MSLGGKPQKQLSVNEQKKQNGCEKPDPQSVEFNLGSSFKKSRTRITYLTTDGYNVSYKKDLIKAKQKNGPIRKLNLQQKKNHKAWIRQD